MTLVAHSDLPTFAHLRERGHALLSLERATHQDISELHIGFLNMMPDAALAATEVVKPLEARATQKVVTLCTSKPNASKNI